MNPDDEIEKTNKPNGPRSSKWSFLLHATNEVFKLQTEIDMPLLKKLVCATAALVGAVVVLAQRIVSYLH
jgi:hypothetical protein